jgi:Domain of unknown function (DUF6431)
LLTVSPRSRLVEQMLADGLLRCPDCSGVLAPWGHAWRRSVRLLTGEFTELKLRRVICPARGDHGCGRTHVLLPAFLLARRWDVAELIWAALRARAEGWGWRRQVALVGRAVSTVRGWVARAVARAVLILGHFVQAEHVLVTAAGAAMARVSPTGSRWGDAVAQVGVVLAVLCRGGRDALVHEAVSVVSGGWLLGTRGLRPLLPGSNISTHL